MNSIFKKRENLKDTTESPIELINKLSQAEKTESIQRTEQQAGDMAYGCDTQKARLWLQTSVTPSTRHGYTSFPMHWL